MFEPGRSNKCQVLQTLIDNEDDLGILKHKTFCITCILKVKSKFPPGEEFLWSRAPPPWIVVPEGETDDPEALNKHMRKFETRKILLTPEDIGEYLEGLDCGDEKLVYEIFKYKKVDKVEARKIMREIRRKQRDKQQEKEQEEKNARKQKEADERAAERLRKADGKRIEMGKRRSRNVDPEQLETILAMDKEEFQQQEDVEEGNLAEETEKIKNETESPQKKPTGPAVFNKKSVMPWMPLPVDIIGIERSIIFENVEVRKVAEEINGIDGRPLCGLQGKRTAAQNQASAFGSSEGVWKLSSKRRTPSTYLPNTFYFKSCQKPYRIFPAGF
ncbi:unnamed protein product [Caenorhabditis auriculariae]|uniref:Uncharacterized protein n=1 Tax=Caenorhabditis auriculariae TaxID=2777116 RepID=A0A8S1HS97_9PELO|nr:unnamed protein product [Caenorhabditis auriculariae]